MTLRPQEAQRDWTSNTSYSFTFQNESSAMLQHIGPVPNPASVTACAVSHGTVLAAVFEATHPGVRLVRCLPGGKPENLSLPDSYIVYGLMADRTRPGGFLVAGCRRPDIFSIAPQGQPERIAHIPDAEFIMCLDQMPDGTIHAGTWPGGGLWRIGPDRETTKLPIPEALRGGRSYLQRIDCSDDGRLFLHFMSPGLLLEHDLHTGATRELARTDRNMLPWDEIDARIGKIVRDGHTQPVRRPWFPVEVRHQGFGAVISPPGQPPVHVDLTPLSHGQYVSALAPAGDGRFVGCTYWNNWLYTLDTIRGQVSGHGPIAGADGEFFEAAELDGEVLIPHYLGRVFRYDPSRPFGPDNPGLREQIDGVHLGRSCVRMGGHLLCSTLPDIHQRTGALVRLDTTEARVLARGHTWNCLALSGNDRPELWAGSSPATGLGVEAQQASPTLLTRLRPEDGGIEEQWTLNAPGRRVTGLWAGRDCIVAGTEDGALHRLDRASGRILRDTAMHEAGERDPQLLQTGQGLMAVTSSGLWLVKADASPRRLAGFDFRPIRTCADRDGALIIAAKTGLYRIPPDGLKQLVQQPHTRAGSDSPDSSPTTTGAAGALQRLLGKLSSLFSG